MKSHSRVLGVRTPTYKCGRGGIQPLTVSDSEKWGSDQVRVSGAAAPPQEEALSWGLQEEKADELGRAGRARAELQNVQKRRARLSPAPKGQDTGVK